MSKNEIVISDVIVNAYADIALSSNANLWKFRALTDGLEVRDVSASIKLAIEQNGGIKVEGMTPSKAQDFPLIGAIALKFPAIMESETFATIASLAYRARLDGGTAPAFARLEKAKTFTAYAKAVPTQTAIKARKASEKADKIVEGFEGETTDTPAQALDLNTLGDDLLNLAQLLNTHERASLVKLLKGTALLITQLEPATV